MRRRSMRRTPVLSRRAPLLVPVLLLALGLTACGADEGSGGDRLGAEPTPVAPSSPAPAPTATAPAPPGPPSEKPGPPGSEPVAPIGKGQFAPVTLLGTVREGAEPGCLTLESGGQVYLLLGAVPDELVDAQALVTGSQEPQQASTCQQGTPLRVTTAVPG